MTQQVNFRHNLNTKKTEDQPHRRGNTHRNVQLAPAIALQSKSTMIKIAANRIKMILQGNTKLETC